MISFFSLVGVNIEKIKIAIHTHSSEEIAKVEEYWIKILDISKKNLTKTCVAVSSASKGKRRGLLPYGTCHISICSTELIQKIYKWIELAFLIDA